MGFSFFPSPGRGRSAEPAVALLPGSCEPVIVCAATPTAASTHTNDSLCFTLRSKDVSFLRIDPLACTRTVKDFYMLMWATRRRRSPPPIAPRQGQQMAERRADVPAQRAQSSSLLLSIFTPSTFTFGTLPVVHKHLRSGHPAHVATLPLRVISAWCVPCHTCIGQRSISDPRPHEGEPPDGQR